jgi:hypothetical protein
MIATGRRATLIASHEAEDAVAEVQAAAAPPPPSHGRS